MDQPRVLGIGIIGLGGAAANMLPAFDRSPSFTVVAACDVDAEILERFRKDRPATETFSAIEEICASPAVDLIYIGTPTRLHREHACAALEHKKHVLIEKPMAVTLGEADAMIASADRRGVLLGVNVKHSFEPRIQSLRALTRSRTLGALKMVHSWRYVDWLYQPRTLAERTPQWGAGILWRQGPHQFDLVRTIGGGMVRSVRGTSQKFDAARGVDGAYSAFLEFEDGVVSTVVCSGYDHFDSRDLVEGLKGDAPPGLPARHARARRTLEAHAGDPLWEETAARGERYGGSADTNAAGPSSGWLMRGPLIASFEHGDVRLSRGGLIVDGDRDQREIRLDDRGDGRDGRLATFYRAIIDGCPLPADGRWGKATQEVLVALEGSAATRQEILLKHQTPYADDDEPPPMI